MEALNLVELFGGIGAPRKALENIGIEVNSIDYVEIDGAAVKSYNAIFGENYEPKNIVGYDVHTNEDVDILFHGSPCQDFSVGLALNGVGGDLSRSSLMFETVRALHNMKRKPKVVMWENVTNVLSKAHKPNFDKYLEEMTLMGYTNSYRVLNAIDFGIPQLRKRIFVVSMLDGEFDFDNLETREPRNVFDYIDDDFDKDYIVTQPSMISRLPDTPGGHPFGLLKKIETHVWTISTKQVRLPNGGLVEYEPGKYRYLTDRECWRLMGFTDRDFDLARAVNPALKGKKNGTLNKQAGNSIVVPVLESIFTELLRNN